MKLVDMKRTAAEKKDRNKGCEVGGSSSDDYPYGLTLNLDNDQLKKLGVDNLPKAGETMTLQAKCKVVSIRQSGHHGGKSERSMEIQLQKVGLTHGAGSMVEAVEEALEGE